MAFSQSNFSTVNPKGSAAFDDNVSLFLPFNELNNASVLIWTQAGNTTDADESDTTQPSGAASPRLFDELPHKFTRPDTSIVGTSATWFIAVRFPSPGISIDGITLIHKNLQTLATTVTVEIANDAVFTGPLEIANSGSLVAPLAGRLDERLGFYQLSDGGKPPQQYTSVEFLRVKMTRVGDFIPILHQLVIGSRAQLIVNPLVPFDSEGNRSSVSVFNSRARAKRIHEFARGEGGFTARFITSGSDEFSPLEDVWFRSEQGTRHVVLALSPKSDPAESFLVQMDPPDFFFPFNVAEKVRSGSWDFVEQGPPFVARER